MFIKFKTRCKITFFSNKKNQEKKTEKNLIFAPSKIISMKRHLLPFFLTLALFCSACENQPNNDATSNSFNEEQVVEVTPVVAEPEPPFTSPDLQWANVQGRVKSISETHRSGNASYTITYRFNEEGKLTYYRNGYNGSTSHFKRNSDGRITERIEGDDDPDREYYAYTYDANGYVIKEKGSWFQGGCTTTYHVNQQGWKTKEKDDTHGFMAMYDYTSTWEYTFNYGNTDSDGNWTSCTKSGTMTHSYSNEPDYDFGNKKSKETITRKIVYYD